MPNAHILSHFLVNFNEILHGASTDFNIIFRLILSNLVTRYCIGILISCWAKISSILIFGPCFSENRYCPQAPKIWLTSGQLLSGNDVLKMFRPVPPPHFQALRWHLCKSLMFRPVPPPLISKHWDYICAKVCTNP